MIIRYLQWKGLWQTTMEKFLNSRKIFNLDALACLFSSLQWWLSSILLVSPLPASHCGSLAWRSCWNRSLLDFYICTQIRFLIYMTSFIFPHILIFIAGTFFFKQFSGIIPLGFIFMMNLCTHFVFYSMSSSILVADWSTVCSVTVHEPHCPGDAHHHIDEPFGTCLS